MRDYLLALLILIPAVWALRAPWIGVLAWTVISIMNPHTYSWVLRSMPVAALVACTTLIGVLANRQARQFPLTGETVVLMLLMLWFCVTLPFSFNVDGSYFQWTKVMKIDFMILIAAMIIHSKKQIIALIWVLVVSLGFYGVKGGLFTLATGGAHRVWGPEGSYIEGNNEVALALIMCIPLFQILRAETRNVWVKRGLLASMLLCAVAGLGSHSRGALLALVAMALVLWWRGKNKVMSGIIIVVTTFLMAGFLPDAWFDRMNTISEYKEDGSAMGRINAWWMAFNLAKANFFGGGFDIYNLDNFSRYAPDAADVHAAHSIYFQILGEHGFVGLALFLLLWLLAWRSAGILRKQAGKLAETRWLVNVGAMCQVSLVAYAVGGAFLSLAYFDLPYNVVVVVVAGRQWLEKKRWLVEQDGAPVPGPAVVGVPVLPGQRFAR